MTEAVNDTADSMQILDASGLNCPMPLLKLKLALRHMKQGEIIQLITTDPASKQDIAHFCQAQQHTLIDSYQQQSQIYFKIEK